MEKVVYVLWKRPELDPAAWRRTMLDDVGKRLLEAGSPRIALNLVDEDVAYAESVRITRLDPPPAGTLSIWFDEADRRGDTDAILLEAAARHAAYLVVESEPMPNTTHRAAPGERTPGTNMVALLEKPERLTWEAWIEHWHGHHREVALETQRTWQYVRNVVVRPLSEGAPPWLGIVEEGFETDAVTDPMKWYGADGDSEVLRAHLGRMVESCRAFLDLDRVESHPMSEYRLRG